MPDTIIILIVLILLSQALALFLLYMSDRRQKYALKGGIKRVETFTLKKHKYLLVYYQRKKGIITKRAFIFMIAYYIINITGFIAIFVPYFLGNSSILLGTCCSLIFLNIGLLAFTSSPLIDREHGGEIDLFIAREREREAREKSKGPPK